MLLILLLSLFSMFDIYSQDAGPAVKIAFLSLEATKQHEVYYNNIINRSDKDCSDYNSASFQLDALTEYLELAIKSFNLVKSYGTQEERVWATKSLEDHDGLVFWLAELVEL